MKTLEGENFNGYIELGDITILLFIVILKCPDNQFQREIFSIVILSTQYYHKYRDDCKIHCSETCTSVNASILPSYLHNFSGCSTVT